MDANPIRLFASNAEAEADSRGVWADVGHGRGARAWDRRSHKESGIASPNNHRRADCRCERIVERCVDVFSKLMPKVYDQWFMHKDLRITLFYIH